MPFYVHRGSVDTRFLGVMIRAESLAELVAFSSMGRSSRLSAAQLRELDIEPFVSDLSRLTVLDHEVRHFHDTLLYPFGAAVLREQALLVINGVELVRDSVRRSQGANVLPIPLQEWLVMPSEGRDKWLRRSNYPGIVPVPPDFPVVDPHDRLRNVPRGLVSVDGAQAIEIEARAAVRAQRILESLWWGPQPPTGPKIASTVALWEVPGTVCQLAAIRELSDDQCAQRYADWFFQRGPKRYQRGFQALEDVTVSKWGPDLLRELLALSAWLQMGRYRDNDDDLWTSSPLNRLGRLREARSGGMQWRGDESFLDLIARWDEAAGTSSIDGLHDSTSELAGLVERSEQRSGQVPDSLPFSAAAAGLRAYYDAHLQMKNVFLRNPDQYIDTAAYVARRTDYPLPMVKISYREQAADGRWMSNEEDATPPEWTPAINERTADLLAQLVDVTSAVFLPSEETPGPGDDVPVRTLFHLEPLRWHGSNRPIDREGIFKQLLSGKVSGGYDLLEEEKYEEVIQWWALLAVNRLFSVSNPVWAGLPYYSTQILQGKCQLFIARVQLRSEDRLTELTSAAFLALADLVESAPATIEELSAGGLLPQEARAVYANYLNALQFAQAWIDWWGPNGLLSFAGTAPRVGFPVIAKVQALIGQAEHEISLYDAKQGGGA